ncbi:MAG TPA: TonB family protein [Terriglobia bacterium]|nr:TonB family protein [Terriglobia bacterium]
MKEEPELHFVLDEGNDVAKWRRRTAFLAAVLGEFLLILLLLAVTPYLQRRAALMRAIAEQEQPHEHATFLVMPPDLERELRKPKTNILSDKNRIARGPSPVVKPKGPPMPLLHGNTHLPKLAGGSPPPPPKEMTPPAAHAAQPATKQEAKNTPSPPKPEEKPKITLSDIKPPEKSNPLLAEQLGMATPGQMIQQSAQQAARGRALGQIPGPGDSVNQLNNLNPNFSTSGPIILSDTQGVDFGPYLAQILMIVRENWYAVIPESARLGAQGRTSLVFEILKDGSVPQLRLVGPSGSDSLDRAAEAGIRASIPFPPLPKEFTGKHLVLQFNFFYNMRP